MRRYKTAIVTALIALPTIMIGLYYFALDEAILGWLYRFRNRRRAGGNDNV